MSDIVYYIISVILTAGVLIGIALMSKVKYAKAGNLLSSVCIAAAILVTLYRYEILSDIAILIFTLIGLIIGLIAAKKVKMISMPQVVAILNGFGGLASAIVGFLALNDSVTIFANVTSVLAVSVGTITFTGSVIAAAKLQRIISQKPVIIRLHNLFTNLTLVLIVCSIVYSVFCPNNIIVIIGILNAIISALFGTMFSIRVGGADMPITISLLNSLSGVAGAIAGMAISDPLLVAIGGVVGASGLVLTQIMCRAMNRSLKDILLGKTSAPTESTKPAPVETAEEKPQRQATSEQDADINAADILNAANNVIIIPGYGMALSQAQEHVKRLFDKLEQKGKKVVFAIHPVAGRMPGHMNVLLAEVDVDYESLLEMEQVNPMFAQCDVAIVIGANDVVNPAANTAKDTPIYGMPILNVTNAKNIIVCNFDLKPGYAGVENPLYKSADAILMIGDAKDTVNKLIEML